MLAKLHDLKVEPSFSRPSVSNDNPFSESLFRTLKYRPNYPDKCFIDHTDAQRWVKLFVRWYNGEHKHSALKFVTPNQRHTGADVDIRQKRRRVIEAAKMAHECRWSGPVRNLDVSAEVSLNPNKSKEGKHAA